MSTRKSSKKKTESTEAPDASSKRKRSKKGKASEAEVGESVGDSSASSAEIPAVSDSVAQEESLSIEQPHASQGREPPSDDVLVRPPPVAVFDSGMLREIAESLDDIEAAATDPRAMSLSKRQATLMRVDSLLRVMVAQGEAALPLIERADKLTTAIRHADVEQFESLRARVARGEYGPDDLRTDLFRMTPFEWNAFVMRLFDVATAPERRIDRQDEMVDYVPTPVLSIFELASTLTESDVLFDIGSGLGLVVLLSAWLSRAKAVGIEIEPSYVEIAEARARFFGIDRARFQTLDARYADLSEATVVYLYYPARGALLDQILGRIRAASEKRPIRIYSSGRSSQALAESGFAKSPVVFPSGMVRFLAGE